MSSCSVSCDELQIVFFLASSDRAIGVRSSRFPPRLPQPHINKRPRARGFGVAISKRSELYSRAPTWSLNRTGSHDPYDGDVYEFGIPDIKFLYYPQDAKHSYNRVRDEFLSVTNVAN